MAAAVGVADLSQTLEREGGHPVDPLDLEEINFSCGITEKEIDEFDFPDDIFQKIPNEESGPVWADEWIVQDASASGVGPNLTLITQSTAGDEEFHVPDIDYIKQRPNDSVQNVEILGGGNVKSTEDDARDLGGVTLTVTERDDIDIPEDQDENIPGALLAAQAEWDSVQCVEAGFGDPSAGVTPVEIKTTPLITFNEALLNFQTTDMKSQKKAINMTVHRRGLSAFVNMIFGPPALQKDLGTEKEMAFCMAASSFENENETHFRVLQTIYRTLTGSKFDCSRYGSHFEEIGFQGNDPATDLRGSGMLGLMQILHLLTDPTILPLTRDIYKLSLDETQNFPFCLMGINITRITLQAMREGCLNRDCNKRKQVLAVMNDFYVGTYLHLYEIWKHQHKTISDSGFVLKDVEHYVKKNPKNLMKRLNTYLSKKKDNSMTSVSNKSDPEGYVTIDKL